MRIGQHIRAVLDTLNNWKNPFVEQLVEFFRAGRSAYVFVVGILLLLLAGIVMVATFDSREAQAAPSGWSKFVAATGSNQWVSCTFLLSAGCIVLSINYLPRLEGEG